MILLEEFCFCYWYYPEIVTHYTSRSFTADRAIWMIDWAHYTDPERVRDRNQWRKVTDE